MGHRTKFLDDIPTGKSNGISRTELARKWNTDRRTVSAIVADLRAHGEIIASGNAGYYRPATDDEHAEYYHTQHSRALSILKTLKASRRALKKAGIAV